MKKQNHILFLIVLIFLVVQTTTAQSPIKLWFDEPATYFEESLVLGNGKMGASVFGGVESDQIYLNDATLWSGEPVDPKKYWPIKEEKQLWFVMEKKELWS